VLDHPNEHPRRNADRDVVADLAPVDGQVRRGQFPDALLPMLPVRMALAPPIVRKRFRIRWSRADELSYRAIRRAIRTGWPLVPASLKWYSLGAAGLAARARPAVALRIFRGVDDWNWNTF
jgi:uncharacterized protein (DUF2236 family)